MYTNEDYERLLVKYTSISKSQGASILRIGDNDDNSHKTNSELKDVIIDLFDQVREANPRNTEKDRMIAALTEKLDAVHENQRQQRLDLESLLAKERKRNKEREDLLKTIKDLNDIVKNFLGEEIQ